MSFGSIFSEVLTQISTPSQAFLINQQLNHQDTNMLSRVAQQTAPGFLLNPNMRVPVARVPLQYYSGLPFDTTKFGRRTPVYPPGLPIRPEMVFRQYVESPLPQQMALDPSMTQQIVPQDSPGLLVYSTNFGRPTPKYPPGLPIPLEVLFRQQVEPSPSQQFALNSNIIPRVAPQHPLRLGLNIENNRSIETFYPNLHLAGVPINHQPEISAYPYQAKNHPQTVYISPVSNNNAQIQQAPQDLHHDNSDIGRQLLRVQWPLTEPNLFELRFINTHRGPPLGYDH